MKAINVESLAGRCNPSSDFVSNRWLAIQTDPLLFVCSGFEYLREPQLAGSEAAVVCEHHRLGTRPNAELVE